MIVMKKVLKIKFVGFWDGFNQNQNILCQTIRKFYDIEETDNPDYIICSVFKDNNNYYEYLNYPQVRILFSGENVVPDFNTVDYAMSSYPIQFQDRHLHYPYCFDDFNTHCSELLKKDRLYTKEILTQKVYFANFIASHDSENNIRGDFFRCLSNYKRIESPGTFLNNTSNDYKVDFHDNSKIDFQRKCKFTICFESTCHEGFITEKITDAFYADTIPIYYGSSDVKNIFNPEAFINCRDYSSFDEVIKKIIEIDHDDNKYLEMLRKPIFINNSIVESKKKEIENFVKNIFNQPLSQSYRRSKIYSPKLQEEYIQNLKKLKSRYEDTSIINDYSLQILFHYIKQKIKAKITKIIKHK